MIKIINNNKKDHVYKAVHFGTKSLNVIMCGKSQYL